ncbi:hypothetical protein, partial [Pacificibacter sp. AS14]|uniref:hypothetical protein n=1 Tax=Pacificibacter sp. AS14 TaxID=3135785 RepID=UPI0031760B58
MSAREVLLGDPESTHRPFPTNASGIEFFGFIYYCTGLLWTFWTREQGPVSAVASTGRRNTLIFRKRWSVLNEVPY